MTDGRPPAHNSPVPAEHGDRSATARIHVLLVDDHCLVREGLAMLLGCDARIAIVGSVGSGEEAVVAALQLLPDLIIMDLVLPALNGIDATLQILSVLPGTRIIALSACHTDEQVDRVLRAGALGFVLKSAAGVELLRAVSAVLGGHRYLSSAVQDRWSDDGAGASLLAGRFSSLSDRERSVLRGIVAGATSAEIARAICLSPKTIDTYRSRIMVKLGVANRSALIQLASTYELPQV